MFDVIVVGAGPAGSTIAKELSEKGIDVLLIEKDPKIMEKPCGGGISKKTLDLVGDIPEDIIECEIRGTRIFSGEKVLELSHEKYSGVTVTRKNFDGFLENKAKKAGTKIIRGEMVSKIENKEDEVVCETVSGKRYSAKFLVGADGPTSIVYRYLNKGKRQYAKSSSKEILMSKKKINEIFKNKFNIYTDSIKRGYGWVFPRKNNISIGVGGDMNILETTAAFKEFIKKLEWEFGLILEIDFNKIDNWVLPVYNNKANLASNRIILIGDAAGFIYPISGEGIYCAILSAIKGAKFIDLALKNGKKEILGYEKEIKRVIGKKLSYGLLILRIFKKPVHYAIKYLKNTNITVKLIEKFF